MPIVILCTCNFEQKRTVEYYRHNKTTFILLLSKKETLCDCSLQQINILIHMHLEIHALYSDRLYFCKIKNFGCRGYFKFLNTINNTTISSRHTRYINKTLTIYRGGISRNFKQVNISACNLFN